MIAKRRELLKAFPALMLLSTGRASAALNQRSYSGVVSYAVGSRANGHETFSVTVQPNGLRTLRARCEIDDSQLMRDVTVTLDADWHPVVAFIQLTVAGQFAGSTWYQFAPDEVVAEGITTGEGRISQRFALSEPLDAFGAHPIHGDAWNLARLRRNGGRTITSPRFSSSARSDGGTGPTLLRLPENHIAYALVGPEKVTVPAGTFDTERFTMTVVPKQKVNQIWATGEDCIPVRMVTSDNRRYELVELSGEPR
jgi:hypothetical protein